MEQKSDKHTEKEQMLSSQDYKLLYSDICSIIEKAQQRAFSAVNIYLTLRNWLLGERIAREEMDGAKRAVYGKKIIETLANDLTAKYGKGFDNKSLYNYIKFYRYFPEIFDAVSRKLKFFDATSREFELLNAMGSNTKSDGISNQQLLPWTHYRELIRVENPDARKWYEQEALREV